jgi:hypothetical protein
MILPLTEHLLLHLPGKTERDICSEFEESTLFYSHITLYTKTIPNLQHISQHKVGVPEHITQSCIRKSTRWPEQTSICSAVLSIGVIVTL